jgi:hypothetical protein
MTFPKDPGSPPRPDSSSLRHRRFAVDARTATALQLSTRSRPCPFPAPARAEPKPTEALSPFGLPCGLDVSAGCHRAAMIALGVAAPCHPDAAVTITHSGMTLP